MRKTKTIRRRFSSEFKSKVALEAIQERYTISELSKKFELHPTQINNWKRELLSKLPKIFDSKSGGKEKESIDMDQLYCKIGKLEMERDFLKKSLRKLGWSEK